MQQGVEIYYNHSSRPLPSLQIGITVRLQDSLTRQWNKVSQVMGISRHRACQVKLSPEWLLVLAQPSLSVDRPRTYPGHRDDTTISRIQEESGIFRTSKKPRVKPATTKPSGKLDGAASDS